MSQPTPKEQLVTPPPGRHAASILATGIRPGDLLHVGTTWHLVTSITHHAGTIHIAAGDLPILGLAPDDLVMACWTADSREDT